ncbi:MAG: hypothetical protein SH817_14745 [Leptospira sp.]|nr:hypothetical protein [Leptospira sp.]
MGSPTNTAIFLLALYSTYNACLLPPVPGKCEKEEKKKKNCIITNFIACELSSTKQEYAKSGINICTNPDGFLFALSGSCDGHVSYECGGPSSRNSSK